MTPALAQFMRSLVAGCCTALLNIGLLYFLTEYGGLYYLLSASIAYVVAFVTNFVLQKYWVFQENQGGVGTQFVRYVLLGGLNFTLNLTLLYALTEWARLWYIGSQVLVTGLLFILNFLVARAYIFHTKPEEHS